MPPIMLLMPSRDNAAFCDRLCMLGRFCILLVLPDQPLNVQRLHYVLLTVGSASAGQKVRWSCFCCLGVMQLGQKHARLGVYGALPKGR